jgi:hypothetical protein
MTRRLALLTAALFLAMPSMAPAAKQTYESIVKGSTKIYNLKRILRPFVTTCERKRSRFKRLFCEALNERLKAQHQAKTYLSTVKPSAHGPLVVRYRARPKPTLEIAVRGCLTCKGPMLDRRGGDVSKGRFFLFKVPKEIKIRRGKNPYDLGDIDVATYKVELPKKMTEKKFKQEILPFLRLDLVFRPVAGVTRVGRRFKYGVINFELVAHRVFHKCAGNVYGAEPRMKKMRYLVDKNDLSCPQNKPKKVVAKPKLPSTLPQRTVRELMGLVSGDMHTCYEQFGVSGRAPADIVVSPNGQVKHVKVVGKLAGTPTGKCVERLVKNVRFPKFAGEDARLQWPFSLRD